MAKPTADIDPTAPDMPFYFTRISPDLFRRIDTHRLGMGYNKRKTVEVMAEMFLTLKPGEIFSPSFGKVKWTAKKKKTPKSKKGR